jgi:hypothetical protein
MQIGKHTVVSINYHLFDSSGKLIEKTPSPVSYLHGGFDAIFPAVERALDGKRAGDECEVRMEPEEAFGDYDEQLVRVEPRDRFPENISVGMQFEGAPEGASEQVVYTVTDIPRTVWSWTEIILFPVRRWCSVVLLPRCANLPATKSRTVTRMARTGMSTEVHRDCSPIEPTSDSADTCLIQRLKLQI